jgi:hypothetical protein
MSWDFGMYYDDVAKCKHYGQTPQAPDCDMNYTFNVAQMFYHALPNKDGIRGYDGKKGEEAIDELCQGLQWFDDPANAATIADLEPSNGWGDSSGAIRVLCTLIKWCRDHPKATLSIT